MKKKNISVLIPDGESHILIHVVNCLAQIKDIKIYMMSNQKNVAMRYSRYVYNFSYYKKTINETDWINNINEELEKYNIDIIMPIFENGIRTIIKYQQKIIRKEKLCILPSINDFNTAINKGLLSKHLVDNSIPSPKYVLLKPRELFKNCPFKYPIIVKPLEGFGGGRGICVFENENAAQQFFLQNKFDYTYLIQEYIKGYDIDCSVLCKDGNIIAYTMQKGTMIGKNQFSPQVGLRFLDSQKLYELVQNLMKSLNWSGVAHLDLRYDEVDEQFKVIEINTRFWVSLDASLIAGVNFPYLYCLASSNESFLQPKYQHIDYLNLKGLVKRIKNKFIFIFNLKFILNNTQIKFVIKDPIPIVYKYISRTKNILVSKLKSHN